jgi:hypothetical protein
LPGRRFGFSGRPPGAIAQRTAPAKVTACDLFVLTPDYPGQIDFNSETSKALSWTSALLANTWMRWISASLRKARVW